VDSCRVYRLTRQITDGSLEMTVSCKHSQLNIPTANDTKVGLQRSVNDLLTYKTLTAIQQENHTCLMLAVCSSAVGRASRYLLVEFDSVTSLSRSSVSSVTLC